MYNDKKKNILCASENNEKGLPDTLLKKGRIYIILSPENKPYDSK
jgi:hypothetical protein